MGLGGCLRKVLSQQIQAEVQTSQGGQPEPGPEPWVWASSLGHSTLAGPAEPGTGPDLDLLPIEGLFDG